MRKIWKMRKVFLPQAVTLLILVISAALAPNMGMGSTALPKTESSASDGTIITTTYESGAEGGEYAASTGGGGCAGCSGGNCASCGH